MLLAIDVGNTNIVVGVFEGSDLRVSWRLLTLRERTADEVGLMVTGLFSHEQIPLSSITAIVMASVVPPLTPIMLAMAKRYFGHDALLVNPTSNAGMPILYKNPEEVGADRIANSIAAYETYGKAQKLPLIIADLGTATTFDAVTAKGEYLGGVICPGPQIAAEALFQRGTAAACRRAQAEGRHRPDDGRRHRIGSVLRLSGHGRGHRVPDDAGVGR